MKKIILITFLLFISLANIFASDNNIVDNANLLSNEEENILIQRIDELKATHNIDFVIYTDDEYTDSVKMKAADIYDYGDYLDAGVMLYINMANREYFVLTSGEEVINILTDYGLDEINLDVANNLSDGSYLNASLEYLDGVDYLLNYYYANGIAYDINTSENSAKDKLNQSLSIALFSAILITGAVAFILIKQLKSIAKARNANDYSLDNNSFIKADITRSSDMFLYRTLTRVKIQTNNSSGGSSTFTGSSGTSHGGRGGSF